MVNVRGVVFHHDKKSYVSLAVRTKVLEFDWDVLTYSPYSPDLVPSNYYLFLFLKNFLLNRKFQLVNEVKNGLEEYFKSKPREFWKNGIMRLPERWQKMVEEKGSYVI